MKDTTRRAKQNLLVLGLSVIMITLCALSLGGCLTTTQESKNSTPHTDAINVDPTTTTDIPSSDLLSLEDLDTKVFLLGNKLPEGSVSAQYALSTAADLTQKAFGLNITGKALCVLYKSPACSCGQNQDESVFWEVTVETNEGVVFFVIDPLTGQDTRGDHLTYVKKWEEKFDAMTEESYLREMNDTLGKFPNCTTEHETPEDYSALISEEYYLEYKTELDALAEQYKDSKYLSEALELANASLLNDDAQVTLSKVVGVPSGGYLDGYDVELQLSDGSYLHIRLTETNMALFSYSRSERSSLESRFPLASDPQA